MSCDLQKGETVETIMKHLKNNNFSWNRKCFAIIANITKEQFEFIINPFEIVEGITQCKKCGNKKIYMFQKQTRSGDETATTSCLCTNKECNSRWIYSG